MHNPFKIFNRIKIRLKFMLSYIIIIFFTVLMIGISSLKVSETILKDNTMRYSGYLMEQLAANISTRLRGIEDLQFSSYKYSELGSYIDNRQNETDLDKLNKARKIYSSLFDLLYSRPFIKAVLVVDKYGEKYWANLEKDRTVDLVKIEGKIDIEKVKARHGTTIWTSVEQGQLLMERELIHLNDTQHLGMVALVVDTSYVTELYKGIDKKQGGSIILLDGDNNICVNVEPLIQRLIVNNDSFIRESDSSIKTVNFEGEEYILSRVMMPHSKLKLLNIISVKELTRNSQVLKTWILLTCVSVILIAVVIATFVSQTITSNIRILLKGIKEFSEGKFGDSIKPRSEDEIGVLTEEFNKMADKISTLIYEVYNAEILKKNAEYKALQFEYSALQSKINPHFLYNTLETVNSMAKIKGEKEISEMVYLLGNLLRESISGKSNTVFLGREIEYIRNYLRIQKMTYGDKFDVIYHIDEEVSQAIVPKFILQPIVENAIVHGIEEKMGNGRIEIGCKRDNSDLVLEVFDDGIGMQQQEIRKLLDHSIEGEDVTGKHTKVGVRAVDKRIRILYGDNYGLKISSVPGEGTKVTITMPLLME